MSMFFCNECGNLADADDGCGETEDGMGLVCLDCVCEHCGEKPVRTELDGVRYCQKCADAWVRGEGQIP